MPLHIVRNDITKMKVDAIVNAANTSLLGGGGVDGAIHRAAGPRLLAECVKLGGCPTGSAKVTKGYRLPCQYVIHAVGPRWRGGSRGEREQLISCYRTALALAKDKGCETVAFPLISSGVYGYPKDQALEVAVDTIGSFLLQEEMTVYLVIFDRAAYKISEALFDEIETYIDDNYVDSHADRRSRPMRCQAEEMPREAASCQAVEKAQPQRPAWDDWQKEGVPEAVQPEMVSVCPPAQSIPADLPLEEAVKQMDESFSEMLLRKISESGMTDAQCYKKANIDRKLFSKIRSDKRYRPSKPTAIAFAIALELPLEETREMLLKAGFALSHSNQFDIIIEYFIVHKNYNIFQINEALFSFDQNLLGA